MPLPSGWYRDPRAIQAYIDRENRILLRSHQGSYSVWLEKVQSFQAQGKSESQAQELAARFFLPFMITKGSVPLDKRWNGRNHQFDETCNCCQFLKRCGVIDQPGRLRYLGEFFAGSEKIAKDVIEDEGEVVNKDVSFGNYLAAWRCDLCGNEHTDGY